MNRVLIDTRGLSCPLPVLKVRKTMRNAAAGIEASVLATDPLAEQDIRSYCEVSACDFLLAETLEGGVIRIVIQKR